MAMGKFFERANSTWRMKAASCNSAAMAAAICEGGGRKPTACLFDLLRLCSLEGFRPYIFDDEQARQYFES